MKIIYVAGALTPKGNRPDTDNPAIEYLLNVRDMISISLALIQKGWAPYCPAIDFSYFLHLRVGEQITERQIKDVSLAFLEPAAAMFMLPRWEKSQGSVIEREKAILQGKAVYYSLEEVPDQR